MASINLLPTQLALKGKDKIVIEAVRKIALIGFLLLILASLVIAGYLVYALFRVRLSVNNEEALKSEIGSFQQTEQGLFLIKNRLSRIKSVLAKESANDQITKLSGLLQALPPDFRVLEIQVTSQKVTLSLIFFSSDSFGNFYKRLIDLKLYSSVSLKSLSFNPSAGYLATFELSGNETN